MDHELLLIKAFVIKERQQRYINLVTTAKGRKKFRNYISHFSDLNANYCVPLHSFKTYSQLYDRLRSEGSLDMVYIIAANSQYDMQSLSLLDATKQLFSSDISYFISCIPGKLAYYEGEEKNQRYLLKAPFPL